MTDFIKEYLKKNGPAFGVVSAVGGFVTDVLAPLANFALYLLLASIGGLLATGAYYLFAKRDDLVTKREAAFTKLVFFGFFVVIWGILSFVHVVGPEQGVIAATVPGMEELQVSLGILQKDVADIKADTTQILAELRDLKSDLANAQSGSISSSPNSAEAWYTNAILYASQGDDEKAIHAYQQFFLYGYPYVDAYQSFNILARSELSKKELEAFYKDLANRQPTNILASLMVGALEKDTEKRRAAYDAIRTERGDSSLLLYWMINEYSAVGTYIFSNELSAEEAQKWTTSDQSVLKELTRAYDALPVTDSLEPYFISSFAYDGAKTLINSLGNQFEDETVSAMLDTPVILVVNPTGEPDQSNLNFVIYDSYTDILYRIPGYINDFTSTIPEEPPSSGPWGTSAPIPELVVTVNVPFGAHDVEVYWLNANHQKSKTYTFKDAAFLNFSDWSKLPETPVWEYPEK